MFGVFGDSLFVEQGNIFGATTLLELLKPFVFSQFSELEQRYSVYNVIELHSCAIESATQS